jgi:hypothetical protein
MLTKPDQTRFDQDLVMDAVFHTICRFVTVCSDEPVTLFFLSCIIGCTFHSFIFAYGKDLYPKVLLQGLLYPVISTPCQKAIWSLIEAAWSLGSG